MNGDEADLERRLHVDRTRNLLMDGRGRSFRPDTRCWSEAGSGHDGECVDAVAAVRWLQRDSGSPLRWPVAVVGTRAATDAQRSAAEVVGMGLASAGLTVLCGGREGVMEAVCRGVARAGGVSVGLLPDGDVSGANDFVTIPLATGIGVARNALIARAAFAMIAVGGGNGTLSEIAFALQFGRPVFTLGGAPEPDGVRRCTDAADAVESICLQILGLAPA